MLTKKQKRLIQAWYFFNKDVVRQHFDVVKQPEFNILEDLEKIKYSETLYTDINRYIHDLEV